MKRITNKKKLTNIPPIFHNNIYLTNFQQKANIFNNYFSDQCKIHDNGSVLPGFISKTSLSLSEITITTDQITITTDQITITTDQITITTDQITMTTDQITITTDQITITTDQITITTDQITITTDQICEIIQRYNSKKAHGCDEISVAMLQVCACEVALSLSLIFRV